MLASADRCAPAALLDEACTSAVVVAASLALCTMRRVSVVTRRSISSVYDEPVEYSSCRGHRVHNVRSLTSPLYAAASA